jgi:hypothetical protein
MTEEEAYALVAAELQERNLKPGLWAKALAESVGNENVAKSLYLKFRAAQLLRDYQAAKERRESEVFQTRMVAIKTKTGFAMRQFFLVTFAIVFGLLTATCALCALVVFFGNTNSDVKDWVAAIVILAVAGLFGLATAGSVTAACVRRKT